MKTMHKILLLFIIPFIATAGWHGRTSNNIITLEDTFRSSKRGNKTILTMENASSPSRGNIRRLESKYPNSLYNPNKSSNPSNPNKTAAARSTPCSGAGCFVNGKKWQNPKETKTKEITLTDNNNNEITLSVIITASNEVKVIRKNIKKDESIEIKNEETEEEKVSREAREQKEQSKKDENDRINRLLNMEW